MSDHEPPRIKDAELHAEFPLFTNEDLQLLARIRNIKTQSFAEISNTVTAYMMSFLPSGGKRRDALKLLGASSRALNTLYDLRFTEKIQTMEGTTNVLHPEQGVPEQLHISPTDDPLELLQRLHESTRSLPSKGDIFPASSNVLMPQIPTRRLSDQEKGQVFANVSLYKTEYLPNMRKLPKPMQDAVAIIKNNTDRKSVV